MTEQKTEAQPSTPKRRIKIERTFDARVEDMWDLWTTKAGIESWWGPDGFRVDVLALELRAGGRLHYAMTATGPAEVEFMKGAGLPLTSEVHATYGEIERPQRFTYDSLVDFVPGVAPYTISNEVELMASGRQVTVVSTVDAMHDDDWTERLVAGRKSQLDKLAKVLP